jgi:ubiquinone/menaquinone biosynthesis C-methylase UbiE
MSNHKEWACKMFDKASPCYGKKSGSFFEYFGKRLVEQVKIDPRSTILVVATGRGAVLFPLAQEVGMSGRVVGIDVSQEMLHETAKEALERNIHNLELLCMDTERLDFFDHSFDFLFCGFALFCFPSLSKALSEFKRVLKPKRHACGLYLGKRFRIGCLN